MIPWDDDLDVIVEASKHDNIVSEIKKFRFDGVNNGMPLLGMGESNCLKMFSNIGAMYIRNWPHNWPFVDIFLFDKHKGNFRELNKHGKESLRWPVGAVFPLRYYYFGGVMLPGPQPGVAKKRYNSQLLRFGTWNHRHEAPIRCSPSLSSICKNDIFTSLDSCLLAEFFPFVHLLHSQTASEDPASRQEKTWELVLVGSCLVHVVELVKDQVVRRFSNLTFD